jgi:hypothetical protein
VESAKAGNGRKKGKAMKAKETTTVQGLAYVLKYGSSCVGCMAWETPYVEMLIQGIGLPVRYQSNTVDCSSAQKIQRRQALADTTIACRVIVDRKTNRIKRFSWVD